MRERRQEVIDVCKKKREKKGEYIRGKKNNSMA